MIDTSNLNFVEQCDNSSIIVMSNDLKTKAVINRSFAKRDVVLRTWDNSQISQFTGYGWYISAYKLKSREFQVDGNEYIEKWSQVKWTNTDGSVYRSIFMPSKKDAINKLSTFGGGMFSNAFEELKTKYEYFLSETRTYLEESITTDQLLWIIFM